MTSRRLYWESTNCSALMSTSRRSPQPLLGIHRRFTSFLEQPAFSVGISSSSCATKHKLYQGKHGIASHLRHSMHASLSVSCKPAWARLPGWHQLLGLHNDHEPTFSNS